MEINPGVWLVHGILWEAVLLYGDQPVKYGGQVWCMFFAWNYVVGNFVYGDQPRCMVGVWNFMVGSFGLRKSIRVYVWWMAINGRQFWSNEVNPGVCLVDGITW